MKKFRIPAMILAAVVLLAAAFLIYTGNYSRAQGHALSIMENANVSETETGYVFPSANPTTVGLIFYPGGLVDARAYAPLMKACADRNIETHLVKMPYHLAVFDIYAAGRITAQHPEIETWIIGGHSLGGAMAAHYLSKNSRDFSGLVLLGAYSTSAIPETVLTLSIYGSEDRILNQKKYQNNRKNLPDNTVEKVIEGGCHAGFGDYGPQAGDGNPSITSEEQTEITADLISEMAGKIESNSRDGT